MKKISAIFIATIICPIVIVLVMAYYINSPKKVNYDWLDNVFDA